MNSQSRILCAALALSALLLASRSSAQPPQLSITEFVHRTYIDSTPYEEAIRYDRTVVPTLLAMLEDPKEEPYWGNIVMTIGMIADPAATGPLERFLTSGEGKLLPPVYIAKTNVLLALGYLVNRSRNENALAFLREGVDPAVWENRIRWTSAFFESPRDRNEQLVIMSILGLALTGQPSVRETLLGVQRAAAAEPTRFRANVADALSTALHDFEIIRSEGLVNYYRKGRLPEGTLEKVPPARLNLQPPPDMITGSDKPAPIVTGYPTPPPLPRASMKKPKLPPRPAKKRKPPVPEPAYVAPPPIKEGTPPR
jgi:hypothetical protein